MPLRLILSILLILGCVRGVASDNRTPKKAPPNIVFIFTDDHAVQSIGAYGSVINKTPHIDRLATTGTVFMNSFCANSICGPSRASILTGKHSHINGFKDNGTRFNPEQMTFPKLLQKAGYETALIGKWHLGSDPQGFDHWEILPGQGSYYNPVLYKEGRKKKQYEGYVTDIVTDLSLEWLKNGRDQSKPFVLMTQHKAPHRNWCPPAKYLTLYDDVDIPEPDSLFDNYEKRSHTLKEQHMSIRDHFFYGWDMKFNVTVPFGTKRENGLANHEYRRMNDGQKHVWDAAYGPKNREFLANPPKGKDLIRWKYQRYIKDYLRCIASVDENVGRGLDYLERNNLRGNTIVMYSSDQGFYLGEHGWYDKRWMFEESMRMPFIISWPGVVKEGAVSHHLIQNIDYAPTFLEVAGVKIPKDIQGKSLVPILKDDTAAWREAVYYHYYGEAVHNVPEHDGVRDKRYKLINFYGDDGYNLFDLKEDSQEMRDVSKDQAYENVLRSMKEKLKALRIQYNAPPLKPRGKRRR